MVKNLTFFLSPGNHFTAGQSDWTPTSLFERASFPSGPPPWERAPGAGEAADAGAAERRTGQFSQAPVSAPSGAAALGEGARKAPAAGGGHGGPARSERGGVQTIGGEYSQTSDPDVECLIKLVWYFAWKKICNIACFVFFSTGAARKREGGAGEAEG